MEDEIMCMLFPCHHWAGTESRIEVMSMRQSWRLPIFVEGDSMHCVRQRDAKHGDAPLDLEKTAVVFDRRQRDRSPFVSIGRAYKVSYEDVDA